MIAPGLWNWDLSVVKSVKITERLAAGIRIEAFNLLNHANFNAPASVLTSPNYGAITTAASPRVLQLAAKLNF